MKFSLAALLAVLATKNEVGSYSPSFVPKKFGSSFTQKAFVPLKATTTAPSMNSLTMLVETSGGMEELHELMEKADAKPLSKQVRKSPSFWKLAGYASIPLSAALGFGLVPSRRLAAHTVGALVTGIAGAVGKSRLDALTEGSAKPAIAQAIIDAGVDNPEAARDAVLAVKDAFGLIDEDFESLCAEIYTSYLVGMVKYNPNAKTAELKELENVRQALDLSNLMVGEAHANAAAEWYRNTCLFTPEEELDDPDHPDRQAMDKFLFLTERAFRAGGETEEAFKFEMTRVAKAMNLSYATALERVADVAEPFYQRALKSTRSKLGTKQVSAAMLERARKTLGISDETAFDLHVACFNQEVREQLGLADNSQESVEELTEAKKVDLGSLKFADGAVERVSACISFCEARFVEITASTNHCVSSTVAVEPTQRYLGSL